MSNLFSSNKARRAERPEGPAPITATRRYVVDISLYTESFVSHLEKQMSSLIRKPIENHLDKVLVSLVFLEMLAYKADE